MPGAGSAPGFAAWLTLAATARTAGRWLTAAIVDDGRCRWRGPGCRFGWTSSKAAGAVLPRPGRLFAAALSHAFKELADVIDDAFARWDRAHLQEFTLADQRRLCLPDPDWEIAGTVSEDHRHVRLSRLHPGEQFVYVFDLGDDWAHLCTVRPQRIDPVEILGILPGKPLPYFGWGDIPDQYRRHWDGDDRESSPPRDPGLTGLPPLRPDGGPVRPSPGEAGLACSGPGHATSGA